MNRTHTLLLGALLLQAILIVLVRAPFSSGGPGDASRALIELDDGSTFVRMELIGPDGERLDLAREDARWVVEQADGFPADGEKIDGLIDDLERIRVRHPVVGSRRYHDVFEVGDTGYAARVKLWGDETGSLGVDLILGSSPNQSTTHARLADEDEVYEIREVSAYELRPEPSSWILRELVDVDRSRVTGMTLTNGSGRIELERADGGWVAIAPAGPVPVDPAAVDELVREATSIRLDEPAGRFAPEAHGLVAPAATCTIRWQGVDGVEEDGSPRETTVLVGAEIEGDSDKRYVSRTGFGFTGVVWGDAVSGLIETALEDLQVTP